MNTILVSENQVYAYINEYIKSQVRKEEEEKQGEQAEVENSKEQVSEVEKFLNEERERIRLEQQQADLNELAKSELEELEPVANEEDVEQAQGEEVGTRENDSEEKDNDKEELQSSPNESVECSIEEELEELKLDEEENEKYEQHQSEASIEEEHEIYPELIDREKNIELTREEREEKEDRDELAKEGELSQFSQEIEVNHEISSSETEVLTIDQEEEFEQENTTPYKEKQREIEELIDHQHELEEILEQTRKIEQEALVEKEQEQEQLDTIEENYEKAKELYSQEIRRRPIYANKETKGFKEWLEQNNESGGKEIGEQTKEQKVEQEKEEEWINFLENWIKKESGEEEEISQMKKEVKQIVEKYNELDELTTKFHELYQQEQLKQLSQTEKMELKALIKTLQKSDPSNIVLFTNLRALKRSLKHQKLEVLDKKQINQILTRFFTRLSPAKQLTKILKSHKELVTANANKQKCRRCHTEIIKKLKHDLKHENNSKELSLNNLANLIKGLSLTQIKKLKSTSKSLRYSTYLEYFYFVKQFYEKNNIHQEKWREMEKLFRIVFEVSTNNTKSLPSQYELENFFFRSYVEPTWELWNSLEWEKYQNSHVLLKRYWCRYCNHIAKVLIEYCQKFSNIPFKAYILKDGECKWREIEDRSKIQNLNLNNLEKNLNQHLNINLEKDILEIRLLNKKYQYRFILENSKNFYNAREFLSDLTSAINNFIKNNLVKKNIELQMDKNLELVNLIRGKQITQYALSLLMGENKEYIEKVIKQNLRYNEHYIINFASLEKLSKNIAMIFEENESDTNEINNAIKKLTDIIENYFEKNKRFFSAKNLIITQNHPNINLNYFNKVFNEEISIEERIEAAYWLGFIFADGYITINARNKEESNEFGINLSIHDKSQLIKFCLAIGANPTYIRDIVSSEKDGKSYFASIFRIYNEEFCKIMENHGIVRKKSKIIELPLPFQTLKENNDDLKQIFLSFLLGYYDGDGIVNRNTIISGSKKFLQQINKTLLNAFGANLNSNIDERTEGNYYLNLERKLKQNMEEVFHNSLERKRRYAKGKHPENIDSLILNLIIQNLNELPNSEMSKIYNDLIEKLSLPKYLKLSGNNLKRNTALKGYKNHHKKWYINRNVNLRHNKSKFKKRLIELIEKIK